MLRNFCLTYWIVQQSETPYCTPNVTFTFRKNQSETSYCTPKVTFPFPFEPMGSLPYSKHFHSLGCTLFWDFYTETSPTVPLATSILHPVRTQRKSALQYH